MWAIDQSRQYEIAADVERRRTVRQCGRRALTDDRDLSVGNADIDKTTIGKAIYGLRKCTVEPVIGIIKEILGFRQFSLRGKSAAAGEWCLVCLAFNLKRLHTLLQG